MLQSPLLGQLLPEARGPQRGPLTRALQRQQRLPVVNPCLLLVNVAQSLNKGKIRSLSWWIRTVSLLHEAGEGYDFIKAPALWVED